AEHYIKANQLDSAAGVFHKMLELDPDNSAMQGRLADLYVRMGKNDEAMETYFRCAQSLRKRGSTDAADESLTRLLTMAPGNASALLMRAQIAVESGNFAGAVRHLENIPNIDSNSEGLSCLLRARLALAQPEEAEPLARKLLVVHDDISGMNLYADWLAARGEFETALRIYSEHSDRVLANSPEKLLNALRTFTERVKENAAALEMVLTLLQKAGEQSQITEVIELLAHALVKKGDLPRARDFYRDLSVLEPQNPVHMQNYRQMVARLGDDPVLRSLTPQEGGKAFMADELDSSAPALEQPLTPQASDAVESALTESELLDSYSLLPKAIATLEAVLPQAPRSARLHQRLATVYARNERFQDAAQSCEILAELYRDAGHGTQAEEYGNLARRYRRQTTVTAGGDAEKEASTVSGDVAPAQQEAVPASSATAGHQPEAAPLEFVIEHTASVLPASPGAEIVLAAEKVELDISDEWQPLPQNEDKADASSIPELAMASDSDVLVEPDEPETSPAAEMLEEIRFYIGQQMWDEAAAVVRKCAALAPGLADLEELKKQIDAAAAAMTTAVGPAVTIEEATAEEVMAEQATASAVETIEAENPEKEALPALEVVPFVPALTSEAPAQASHMSSALESLVSGIEDVIPETINQFAMETAPVAAVAAASVALPANAVEQMPVASVPVQASFQEAVPEVSTAVATTVPMPGDVLSEMFEEFREEAEHGTSDNEDPESHYSLGVAFREMGLLDEAIGELQKVARNIELRRPFRDTLQVYTLLGQCFLEKGIPEAAVRWYEKALNQTPDAEARVAVHYELGSAHEAAGSRPAALQHFMEVYGSNIDYRDVAERIRVLKS
ncbi:MAG: tetratricopeptide repeat protein, partial [Candidatus Korobacteraceae bacterium]